MSVFDWCLIVTCSVLIRDEQKIANCDLIAAIVNSQSQPVIPFHSKLRLAIETYICRFWIFRQPILHQLRFAIAVGTRTKSCERKSQHCDFRSHRRGVASTRHWEAERWAANENRNIAILVRPGRRRRVFNTAVDRRTRSWTKIAAHPSIAIAIFVGTGGAASGVGTPTKSGDCDFRSQLPTHRPRLDRKITFAIRAP